MKIYFVRHGKTLWNLEGKIQGWENRKFQMKALKKIPSNSHK